MKKALCIFILIFISLTCGVTQALRNPQFHHTYEPEITLERSVSDVKTETREKVISDNDQLKVKIVWYVEYNQAVFTVIGPKISKYDESQYEKAFFETIEKWILESDHRYYSYNVIGRKNFFSRKDPETNKPIITMEFRVSLLK